MSIATLNEVAKLAGVSTATVSRVINRSPRVAPDVAQSVQAVIEQVGYRLPERRPGPRAAHRRHLRTANVLLLSVGVPSSYLVAGYRDLFAGVEKAIHENELKLIMASIDANGRAPAALSSREVDGVLLFGHEESLSAPAIRAMQDMPSVCVMRGFDKFIGAMDRVIYNNASVGRIAAQYLQKHGHRCVACINLDHRHPALAPRWHDFNAICSSAGMQTQLFTAALAPDDLRGQMAANLKLIDQMLAMENRATGIFVPAAWMMPAVHAAMDMRGVSPARYDFITVDRAPVYLDRLSPRPALIDINMQLVGERAVQQLLWRRANRDEKNHIGITIEPVLIESDSRGLDRQGLVEKTLPSF